MADDPSDLEAEDERVLELSTIAAIYPEILLDPEGSDPFSASIEICVEPITPLLIRFPTADGAPPGGLPTPPHSISTGNEHVKANYPGDPAQEIHHLSHLPPLNLHISLPEGYPAGKPPVIRLESQCSWLPEKKIQELHGFGHTLWEGMGRDQVVFSYIDHLREAAERGFDLVRDEAQALEMSADLKIALLDYDLKVKRAKFEHETFECGVCLEPKKGTVCHRLLLCSHVFCVQCLQDFYNTCITEGDIGNVKCITPNCRPKPREVLALAGIDLNTSTKDDRTLEPSELLQIPLEQDMVQRYIKLKRKKRLESDRATIYCPRQWCQGPARCPNMKPTEQHSDHVGADKEPEEPKQYDRNTNQNLLPPPAERLAICEDCTFAFCKVCKASWHGEFFVCFPRSQFELTAEERASEDYMKLHTQPCPTCDARAQKTHGCNHMICFKCDTHFCYLCGAYLEKGNPYKHYNTQKSGCYMRLWELEGGDDGEFGHAFAGGGGNVPEDIDSDSDDEDVPLGLPQAPIAPAVARNNEPPAPVHRPPPAAVQPNGGPGLQRFLQMVQNDEEDAWDSDEMDEDDGFQEWWDVHEQPPEGDL